MSEDSSKSTVVLGATQAIRNLGTVAVDGPTYRAAALALLTGKAVRWREFVLQFPNSRAERQARNSVLTSAKLNIALPKDRVFNLVSVFSQAGEDILNKAKVDAPAYVAAARERARNARRATLSASHVTAG